jgi:molybdopterin molybdotransferase
MLEFQEAQRRLADGARALVQFESVPLRAARARVLAEDLIATLDLPPADNSAMDGYAIRFADYAPAKRLAISQRGYAGEKPQPLEPGTAARLFTGGLVPPGADTVVMQEDVDANDEGIVITRTPQAGQHVRRRGEDTRVGRTLLTAGTRLEAAHIALPASQGLPEVRVFARLKIGILTTGDELVEPGQARAHEQIFNSNASMLSALIEGMGADVAMVLHARDDEAELRRAFKTLNEKADLIISVGGASVGDRDLVKPALQSLGAELALWKVRMKPGKPVALAHIGPTPVVCLPGNPVSAFAVFTLLVTPLIRRMQGRDHVFPPVVQLTLRTSAPRRDSREEFLRVRHSVATGGSSEIHPYAHQGSGVVSSLPWADGLARIPAGVSVFDGEKVDYYDFAHWLI